MKARFVPCAMLLLLACAPARARPEPATVASVAAPGTPSHVVHEFVRAFDRHDVDAMSRLVHPDIVWSSVSGDTVQVELRGVTRLVEYLGGYFRRLPSARAEAVSITNAGGWVAVHERASWRAGDAMRAQAALAVYEVRDARIARVWYYPVVR